MKKKKQTEAERQRERNRENARRSRAARREQDRASVRPEDLQALDYEGVKELASKLHRPATSLTALTHTADPFYITPGRVAAAKWFAEIWERLEFESGVHTRRIHYKMVSQDPPLRGIISFLRMPFGMPATLV